MCKITVRIDDVYRFGEPTFSDVGYEVRTLAQAAFAEGSIESAARAYGVPVEYVECAVRLCEALDSKLPNPHGLVSKRNTLYEKLRNAPIRSASRRFASRRYATQRNVFYRNRIPRRAAPLRLAPLRLAPQRPAPQRFAAQRNATFFVCHANRRF